MTNLGLTEASRRRLAPPGKRYRRFDQSIGKTLMGDVLLLIQGFLTFVKSYCFLALPILIAGYGFAYNQYIQRAARADIRNPGTNIIETYRLARVIAFERLSRRDLPTMIYVIGMPCLIALWILALVYG